MSPLSPDAARDPRRAPPTRRRALAYLGVAAAALVAVPLGRDAWLDRTTSPWRVSLDEAGAELEAGRAWLVDIREPSEHAGGVAPGATLVPVRRLAAALPELTADLSRPVLLICQTQGRSRAVVKALHEQGYTQVRYVHAGMSGWVLRGWPLVRPGE